jgi:hypothetical protein
MWGSEGLLVGVVSGRACRRGTGEASIVHRSKRRPASTRSGPTPLSGSTRRMSPDAIGDSANGGSIAML